MGAPTAVPQGVLGPEVLKIDCEAESKRIAARMVEIVGRDLRRRGVVIGMSGGIDSSVCAALAVRAFGPGKVYGLMLPEQESSSVGLEYATRLAKYLGIVHAVEEITPALTALGCYRWRDDAIRASFPDYGKGWKNKIVIAGGLEGNINYFKLVVQAPEGNRYEKRLRLREYQQIVAATNYKQRLRKIIEYFHADRLNYAVVGTPNRLEYDQGFFVKNGDGAADIKPIAHLYKTQVYAIARHMGLPGEICSALPTTDTYSLAQGQDEFFFALPYEKMDIALWAFNHGLPEEKLALFLNVPESQASFIYQDIVAKRRAAQYLHAVPILVEAVTGIREP